MDTPTQRRGTRLLCTYSILLGLGIIVGALSVGAVNPAVVAGLLVIFAAVVLVRVNRAAKR